MIRYYVNKSDVDAVLRKITEMQTRKNWFVNVSVRPYKGRKYDPETTMVIVIG